MVEKFPMIRHVARAAESAGLDKAERRALIEGGENYVNETIKEAHSAGEDVDELDEQAHYVEKTIGNVEGFINLMEGGKENARGTVIDLGAFLRKYGSKEKYLSRDRLTLEEGRLVSVAVKYFEDWFYRGDFLREFETEDEREIYYVGSAFIVNQLAKIKEVQENNKSVSGFEGQKLEQLIEEVRAFAENYLTEENLSKRVEEIKVVLEKKESELQSLLEKREGETQPIDQEIQKNITELKAKYERIYGLLRNSDLDSIFGFDHTAHEVQSFFEILEKYNAFSDFSKQEGCLYELVNKGGSLLEALAEVIFKRYDNISKDDPERREIYEERSSLILTKKRNFQNWLQRNKNDSKEGGKKQQKMSGFEALAKLKEDTMKAEAIELIEGIVSKSYYAKEALEIAKQCKLKGEVVDRYAEIGVSSKNLEIEKIKQELEVAEALFLDRKKIERTLESSIISIKESLRRPAGDLYLLKTIIIATAEQIKANKDTIFTVFSPDKFVTNRLEVFDFSDFSRDYGEGQRNSNGESSYKKIHFIQAHLPFAQFVVEYMKNKKQNNFEKNKLTENFDTPIN